MNRFRGCVLALLISMVYFPAMAFQKPAIPLWDHEVPGTQGTESADIPTLTPFIPDSGVATGAAVVICPGGGYGGLAPHEGKPIAEWLNDIGITGFVLKYRHAPKYKHPIPLLDVSRAVRLVRSRARDWNVDPGRVGVIGFSAGGHLASTLGTHFDPGNPDAEDPAERESSRPDLMILCYPVITMGKWTHVGSRENLMGKNPSDEDIRFLSNELQVTDKTPPAFLFHTADDPVVDCRNSLLFADALKKAGVEHELHIFPHGPHGVGLARHDSVLSNWTRLCADWLGRHRFAVPRADPPAPLEPVPTRRQLEWHDAELVMFFHFGMNTFTNKDWGDGTEDPNLFNPTEMDTLQWVRAAKEAGFKWAILTAKHHDGFCLWPTTQTDHSVKSSRWRDGKGDVVKEFSEACRREGVRFGIYLSPWDRHEPSYKDNKSYDQFFRAQLEELLTTYGPVSEVWFDGAGGKGHVYDFPSYYDLVRRLQPDALIAICGPDIRWVGNEKGLAEETEWSVQPSRASFHGNGGIKVWYPAECDTSIRPSWFWHPEEDNKVKSLSRLMDIYYKSVGRNAVLLLNVPPNDKGLLPGPDLQRLKEFREALDRVFAVDFALGKTCTASNVRGKDPHFDGSKVTDSDPETYWATDDDVTSASLEIDLCAPARLNVIRLEEKISLGQRVESYRVEGWVNGDWKILCRGTTIGHKKLDRIPVVSTNRLRVVIERALACPTIRSVGLHFDPMLDENTGEERETNQ